MVARAELGDQRAVEQLWRWNGHERSAVEIGQGLQQPEGAERTLPVVRQLENLAAKVDTRTGEVAYLWKQDGREAFRDRGDVVTVPQREHDAIRSGLRLAAAKWDGQVRVLGNEAFKRAAVDEAVKVGVHILNPEMQAYQRDVHQERERERLRELAIAREREQKYERGLSRGLGR